MAVTSAFSVLCKCLSEHTPWGFRPRNAWFPNSQLLGPVRNGPVLGMCWDVNPGTGELQRKGKASLVLRCLQAHVAAVRWYSVSQLCAHHPNSAPDPWLESRVWLHLTHLECINWCTESSHPFLKWVLASLSLVLFHLSLTPFLWLAPTLHLLFWLTGPVPPWQVSALPARTLSKRGLSSPSPFPGPFLAPAMHRIHGRVASDYSPNISQFSLRLESGSLHDLPVPMTTAAVSRAVDQPLVSRIKCWFYVGTADFLDLYFFLKCFLPESPFCEGTAGNKRQCVA